VPPVPEEYDIHTLISRALTEAGLEFAHEYRLGARRRVDFMCGGVGIEVKKTRPQRSMLIKQLEKYAESDEIDALILVSPRRIDVPREICGKQTVCVSLNMLWGVALP